MPSAFGTGVTPNWRVREIYPRELLAPFDWTEVGALTDKLPKQVVDEFDAWFSFVAVDVGVVYSFLPDEASQYIVTAAFNDAISLLRHVDDLEGRSAANTARVLFEHLVNLCDVLVDGVNDSERYMDHRHVTASLVGKHRWFLRLLKPASSKRESNRLDGVAARATTALPKLLTKYGSSFKRTWAHGSIFDRAARHGLDDEYEGYRILSGVIHGSSGAMSGIIKNRGAQHIHRIGVDLDLVAMAYAEGLRTFLRFVRKLDELMPGAEVHDILEATNALLSRLDLIRSTLTRIDKETWPAGGLPPTTVTVAALYPNGKIRYFQHDLRDNSIVPAELVDPCPDLKEFVETASKYYRPGELNGRPMTAGLFQTRSTPSDGGKRVPANAILIPPAGNN